MKNIPPTKKAILIYSILSFLIYSILSLLLFFKILPHFNSALPTLLTRYTALALTIKGSEHLQNGESPFYYPEWFYPVGMHAIGEFLPEIIFSLLGVVFPPFIVQNIVILLSFILSAYGMFLLIFYLTEDFLASLFAGLYYSFSPFHIVNMDLYPVFHVEWFPFAILFILKARDEGRWKYILLGSIFVFLTSITNWYYAVFIYFLLGIIFIFSFFQNKKSIFPFMAIGIISFFFILPFLLLTLKYKEATKAGGFQYFVKGSADLLSYFIPAKNHLFFSSLVKPINEKFIANPTLNSNYLSYVGIFLSVIGYLKSRHWLKKSVLVLIIISFILSLGPILQIGGHEFKNCKLPYYFLIKHIHYPFAFTRGTGRYALLVIIGTTILMSFGIKFLRYNRFLLLSLLTLMVIELLPTPFIPKSPEPVPSFYLNLENEKGNFSILELPMRPNGYIILFYNAFHNKTVMGGAGDRNFYLFTKEIERYPFLRQLRYIETKHQESLLYYYEDIIRFDIKSASATIAHLFNIRYAVVHKHNTFILSYGHYLTEDPLTKDIIELLKQAGWELVLEDEYIYVFEIKTPPTFPVAYIGDGWSHVQFHGENRNAIRWMQRRADLKIYSPIVDNVKLTFSIKTSSSSNLTFYLDGESVGSEYITGEPREVSLTLKLKQGVNTLILEGKEKTWYGIMDVRIVPASSSIP